MKKVILLLAFCLSIGNLFAQDADKLRDEGDTALKAKNYPEALTKYSAFLEATNYEDTGRIFNAGFCADQAKKYEEAVKFFDMSIQKNYNTDDSYVGKAKALRDLNKAAEFTATVEAGLKAFPDNTNLEKMLYVYCMKQAQAAQKAGKIDEAEELFKDVLVINNKTYKGNALYSLGILFYNNGAKTLQAATPLATSDADKYATEKAKATADFKKSKDYLEQGLAITPENESIKKSLDAVNKNLAQ